ncbi:MAG: hypothetical protein ACFBSC_12875 [Microcoleaceae cyanobacterium]
MIIQKNYKHWMRQRLMGPCLGTLLTSAMLTSAMLTSAIAFTPLSPAALAQTSRERPFIVYVNSDNPLLLEVVQQVQPGATLREYDDRVVIDVGAYFRESEAKLMVDRLEIRGVAAEIADPEDEKFHRLVATVPTVVPLPLPTDQAIETNVPPVLVFPQETLGLYQVVVSVNDALPGEVRQIAPGALEKVYEGRLLVHAGSFVNLTNANQLKLDLELRGIPADVVQTLEELEVWMALQPAVPAIAQPALPIVPDTDLADGRYFILIPGFPGNLSEVEQNLINLGTPANSISLELDRSVIVVGPFANEELAVEWETYYLGAGLVGAQIYSNE